ncbi:MAG: (Fe-S)-binding protein [Thermoguttaceae bacterium]
MVQVTNLDLPELDCGMCGYRTCDELREQLTSKPDLVKRCIHLSENRVSAEPKSLPVLAPGRVEARETSCGTCTRPVRGTPHPEQLPWHDSLGREFDFYLEHFPEEPGPREIILPHNPLITREMDVQVGDILIGRPLGMSCGCPITHCGEAMEVDRRTGVIVWCVTGPLGPRQKGFKDLGYYIAEGYEGLVNEARCELKVGMRYYFQPHMCMLQWRHSGLLNYLSRNGKSCQVRLEGLWIG